MVIILKVFYAVNSNFIKIQSNALQTRKIISKTHTVLQRQVAKSKQFQEESNSGDVTISDPKALQRCCHKRFTVLAGTRERTPKNPLSYGHQSFDQAINNVLQKKEALRKMVWKNWTSKCRIKLDL